MILIHYSHLNINRESLPRYTFLVSTTVLAYGTFACANNVCALTIIIISILYLYRAAADRRLYCILRVRDTYHTCDIIFYNRLYFSAVRNARIRLNSDLYIIFMYIGTSLYSYVCPAVKDGPASTPYIMCTQFFAVKCSV